jgi:hypothetical protein
MNIKFCFKPSKSTTGTDEILESVTQNKAVPHMHIFDWFKKDSKRNVKIFNMIEILGGHQLLEIQKEDATIR